MFSLETRFIAVDKYILLLVVNRSFSFVKSPEKYELSTYYATMNNFEHAGGLYYLSDLVLLISLQATVVKQ